MNPTALAIVATVLVAWVVSHAFGIGEIIDIIVVVVGVFAVGFAVFTGIDHLYDFAVGVYRTKTTKDLDVAADDLAKAISILGIQAVLAVLFRGARVPMTGKGGRLNLGAPPPKTPGIRYAPTTKGDPTVSAGNGKTSFWGDVVVSTQGSKNEQALVLLHERVHQFLSPKLYLLRGYRASNRASSYVRSSLYRYIEEALAETVAQIGINGVKQALVGIRFPVQQGHMYLRKGGGYNPAFQGHGAVPEGAALVYTALVNGLAFELWFAPGAHPGPQFR